MNVGNSIAGSSDFSQFSLNILKFSVHILLKALLENVSLYPLPFAFLLSPDICKTSSTILPFCISLHGDGFDHHLLYNVTNLRP